MAPAQGRVSFRYGREMDGLLGLRGAPRSQGRDGLDGTSRTADAADVGAGKAVGDGRQPPEGVQAPASYFGSKGCGPLSSCDARAI